MASPESASLQEPIETFLHHITHFAYDRAKEFVDKQKEGLKSSQQSSDVTIWQMILTALSQLALAEKSYCSFLYLSPKWFGRKDAKGLYDTVASEFHKIETTQHQKQDALSANHLTVLHICQQLVQYVKIKAEMIDFFTSLNSMSSIKYCNRDDLLMKVRDVLVRSADKFFHPLLTDLKSNFIGECEVIEKLIETDIEMSKYHYMSSLNLMQQAVNKLNLRLSWLDDCRTKDAWKLSLKVSFMGIKPSSSVPVLYNWLELYKDAIYSKFTLYFYDVLSRQAPGGDMKSYTSRCSIDYYTKIVTFYKKTDAHLVALIMNTQEEGITSPGYVHSETPLKQLTGLEAYPAIFCYSQQEALVKPVNEDGQEETNDMPHLHNSIIAPLIMLINRKDKQLSQSDRPVDEFDPHTRCTFFVSRIDPNVTLTVIYQSKKSDREKKTVFSFLQEMTSQLCYSKLFAELKPS